jgi:hypothetical protein
MFSALAEIPGRLDKVKDYEQLFESPELHKLASYVYVAIFVALEAIMTEMMKGVTSIKFTLSP